MTISKEMIAECKINVIETLIKHLNANENEINQFSEFIENEDPENWTCGFTDELIPAFEEMRKNNK